MFFDRALRNLDTARQARGCDEAITEQQRKIRDLRQLSRKFDIILEDPSCLSKITSASVAAIEAATTAANKVFPSVRRNPRDCSVPLT